MNVMRDYMESSFLHWYYLVAGILSLREGVTPSIVNHHIIIQITNTYLLYSKNCKGEPSITQTQIS